MNFKKAKNKQQTEIKIAVEKSTKAAKETLGKLVLSISIALLIFALVNISSEKEKTTLTEMVTVTTSEEYEEMGTTTSTNVTTTKVTTTTAKQVTTTPVTTEVTVATTEVETEAVDVPATERSVVIEVADKTYMEPVQFYEGPQVVEIVEPEPEPQAPEVNNEPDPEPTVQEQSYYSDDGDYGWSHVAVRYGTPSLDADKERYHTANEYVTEEERILLVNIVASEYGSDWVSVSEKAKVVAVVMNRVNENYNGKTTIYDVLTDYGQFQGYSPQSWFYRSTTPTCIDAVDYYFLHKDEWQYQGIKYISGHGSYNSFS